MANPSHKKRDRTKENFAKSCKSSAARFNKLNQKYNARIYLQVQWRGRYYEYNSSQDLRWLKIGKELEVIYPLPVQWTPATFEKDSDTPKSSLRDENSDRSSNLCHDQKDFTSSSSGGGKPDEV
ncbi:hypothetical protein VDGL01_08315 [Verticillium dahliae]